MADAIDEVEGIGKAHAEKLKAAGIKTTDQFLERAKDRKGRQALAKEFDIEESRILKWANHCDLFRIKGVAGQMAELLEAAGVDTVRELSRRVPANLAKAMAEANDKRKLCDRPPGESVVAKWVEEAKSLAPIMTY
jgi:predicted flap endonuclease-1-like 5' DNA nuclease